MTYVGRHDLTLTQIDNGTPHVSGDDLRIEAFDGNNRVYEFEVESQGNGSVNTLRLQLANGATSVLVDLTFPVVAGGGTFRLVHKGGSEWTCSGIYAPNAAGNAVRIAQATADTSPIGNTKFVQFHTLAGGGTASTMQVKHLVERISGPEVVGL
jgi:hypothetical protein